MADPVYKPDARRDADAVVIAKDAGQWLHITLREPMGSFKAGERFYGIPSSQDDGSRYITNFRYCSCRDYENRGQGCKHQRAALLHAISVRQQRQQQEGSAEEADPTPANVIPLRSYAALFPPCKTPGCDDVADLHDGYCDRCASEREYQARFATVEARA